MLLFQVVPPLAELRIAACRWSGLNSMNDRRRKRAAARQAGNAPCGHAPSASVEAVEDLFHLGYLRTLALDDAVTEILDLLVVNRGLFAHENRTGVVRDH